MALKHLAPDAAKERHEQLIREGWEHYSASPIQHSYRRDDPVDDLVGLPNADALRAAGFTTREDVFAASDDDLLGVPGIGEKSLAAIRAEQE